MKQKFRIWDHVKIIGGHEDYVGNEAFVKGSYSQMFGGDNIEDYSLCIIKDGEVVDNVSWFGEDEIEFIGRYSRSVAEEMDERFRLSESESDDTYADSDY